MENKQSFDKSQFEADTVSKREWPYCQILNDKQNFGLFVPVAEADKVGFKEGVIHPSKLITHQTNTGGEIKGFLWKAPKMLIVRETELLMRVRRNANDEGGRICLFDQDYYQGNKETVFVINGAKTPKVSTLQRWLIYLLDGNNQYMHALPLMLTLRARLSVELNGKGWKKVKNIFNKYFWEGAKKTGTGRFNSLIVFHPTFEAGLVGEGQQKTWACVLKSFSEINENNYLDYFVGNDNDMKDLIYDAYDTEEEFCKYPTLIELLESQNKTGSSMSKPSQFEPAVRPSQPSYSSSSHEVEHANQLLMDEEVPW